MLVGYARDNDVSQSLERQLKALSDAGCAKIFSDQDGGLAAGDRNALERALDFIRDKDTLVVTTLDRLGQSPRAILDVIGRLAEGGVNFRCLEGACPHPDSVHEGQFWPSTALSLGLLEPALHKRAPATGPSDLGDRIAAQLAT